MWIGGSAGCRPRLGGKAEDIQGLASSHQTKSLRTDKESRHAGRF